MNGEFKLPQNAFVNKFVAKNKFYERASLSSKLKSEFINRIHKITWKYKLAEDTIGITKTDKIDEIQIFEIELKEQVIPGNVLKVIDKTIPYPILYRFVYKNNIAYGITLKENNITLNYYFSEWNKKIHFDFTGIDLEKVYQKLIKVFITNIAGNRNDFEDVIDTDNKIKKLEKEIETLNNKIGKEKQFNRKVAINKVLFDKKQELELIVNCKL